MKILNEEAECSCREIVSKGKTGTAFDLSGETLSLLLCSFNIKIQKITQGYICYQGHNIGGGQNARTQGEAFSLFLRANGCQLGQENVSEEILRFCEKNFGDRETS